MVSFCKGESRWWDTEWTYMRWAELTEGLYALKKGYPALPQGSYLGLLCPFPCLTT